jgi:hypothetical protein
MKYFRGKPGIGFLCCLCGLMLVTGLLSLPALFPGVLEAQTQLPENPRTTAPASQTPALPDSAPAGTSTLVLPQPREVYPSATPPQASRPQVPDLPARSTASPEMRSRSIDQLLEQLQDVRAKRAEMERQEKEIVAAVRERLMEQKQRLQTLGVQLEEPFAPRSEGARYDSPRTGIDDGRK